MDYWEKKLIREQLDKKLKGLQSFLSTGLEGRWIKTMRDALGMTSSDLGKRAGINQSRVIHMEQAEKEGNIKISTMDKIAKCMGMKFVYGFVPEQSLEALVREQAKKLASQKMAKLNHTMALEEQALSKEEKEKAMEDMITKILMDNPKNFWKP